MNLPHIFYLTCTLCHSFFIGTCLQILLYYLYTDVVPTYMDYGPSKPRHKNKQQKTPKKNNENETSHAIIDRCLICIFEIFENSFTIHNLNNSILIVSKLIDYTRTIVINLCLIFVYSVGLRAQKHFVFVTKYIKLIFISKRQNKEKVSS